MVRPGVGAGHYHPKPGFSIVELHPEIIDEWNEPELDPSNFSSGSSYRINWKCRKCSHIWITPISGRTNGTGCPYCSGNSVHSDGRNSLANCYPEIAKEWNDPETKPEDYTLASSKKVPWKCITCSHEWDSVICGRTTNNRGCPACVGQAVHNDLRNSLGTVRPELRLDWNHPLKTIDEFTFRSGKKVPWKCHVCSHEWESFISNRSKGVGCPYCNNNSLHSDGHNALTITHPELCEEWAHEKFQHKTITAGYDKKVKWKCNDCDLIWSATVYHRAHEGTGCPVCMGHEIHPDGRNSLGVLYPELVKEWDDEKISPFEIRESSNNKINWKCIGCNYKWKTAVANRTGKNATGCPQCADWGFNPDEPAFYYAMEIKGHNGNWWWKGGVTCNLERRRRDIQGSLLSNGMDLKVVIVDFLEFDKGEKALKFEKLLLSINDIRVTCKEKFDGSNELFNINPLEHATTNGIAINGKNPQTKLSSWLS